MKYFQHVRNLFVNAEGFTEGFLGLDWFPSDVAKRKEMAYEGKVARLLYKLWGRFSSAWIMYEIATASTKKVEIMPSEFAPDFILQNVSGGDIGAKTATMENTYVDASKKGEQGMTCFPTKQSERVTATGAGADVVMAYLPDHWTGQEGPGSAADEILIHELVHASRMVRGVRNSCFGAPKFWGDYEEFVAITLCNVFSSETKRALRFGNTGFQKMPANQSTAEAFLEKNEFYLKPIESDHPHLFKALKRAPGIPFNPFALM